MSGYVPPLVCSMVILSLVSSPKTQIGTPGSNPKLNLSPHMPIDRPMAVEAVSTANLISVAVCCSASIPNSIKFLVQIEVHYRVVTSEY